MVITPLSRSFWKPSVSALGFIINSLCLRSVKDTIQWTEFMDVLGDFSTGSVLDFSPRTRDGMVLHL